MKRATHDCLLLPSRIIRFLTPLYGIYFDVPNLCFTGSMNY